MGISARTTTVRSVAGKVGKVFCSNGAERCHPSAESLAIAARTRTMGTLHRLLWGSPEGSEEEIRAIMKSVQDRPMDSLDLDTEISEIGEQILALEEKWRTGIQHKCFTSPNSSVTFRDVSTEENPESVPDKERRNTSIVKEVRMQNTSNKAVESGRYPERIVAPRPPLSDSTISYTT